MHNLLLVASCLVALAAARVPTGQVEPLMDYHKTIGIPLATRIKETEDAIMGRSVGKDHRMGGGVLAPTNAHPYLAGLLITFVNHSGTSACGASLVSSNRLVTAAHCWMQSLHGEQFVVVLGSNYLFYGGSRFVTNTVVVHPQYNANWFLNDIAVIYLPTDVQFSDSIQPIALPSGNQLWDQFVGEWGVAAGFGNTHEIQVGLPLNPVVTHVNLQVISVAQCQAFYGTWAHPSQICTSGFGGVGICYGDSGGPLVIVRDGQNILVGIGSYRATVGCQRGYPSGFTRVTNYVNFITQHIQQQTAEEQNTTNEHVQTH